MSAIPTVNGSQARSGTTHGRLLTVDEDMSEAVPAPVTPAAMKTPAANWRRTKTDWTSRMVPTVNWPTAISASGRAKEAAGDHHEQRRHHDEHRAPVGVGLVEQTESDQGHGQRGHQGKHGPQALEALADGRRPPSRRRGPPRHRPDASWPACSAHPAANRTSR